MSTTPSEVTPRNRGFLLRTTSAIDSRLRGFFFNVGWVVAGHPFKIILASILLVLLSLIGMLRFRTESRAGKLWVPTGTVALKNQAYVEDNYDQVVRSSGLAFQVRANGPALDSKQALLEMIDVAEEGFNVVADPLEDETNSTSITFPQRCIITRDAKDNQLCNTISVFNFFYQVDNAVKLPDDTINFYATVRKGVNDLSEEDIREKLKNPPSQSFDGSPINTEEIIGRDSRGVIKVLRYIQFIENNLVVENGDRVDKEADALEEKWTETVLETTDLLKNRKVIWFAESQWSQGDSLNQALTGDLPLLSFGFVLLGIYVVLYLGDFHAIRSHMLLAVGALITAGLSLGACFGISSAFGMFFGPVHQILPLLIIGIGIDDCFHVTRAADEFNLRPDAASKPSRLRIALAISTSGSAITVTSFTNVVVFLLSAISRLPALRFFALWAAIGIFFAWLFTLTFYTALLTLDTRRMDGKRRDCCPCFKVKEVKELNWFKRPAGGFTRFFGNQLGPFIMRPVVKVILLVLFIGLLAANCYGTSQLYLKFQFSFFYPSDSAQREYQDTIDDFFELGDPTSIYVRDRDLSTRQNQARLLQLCKPETGVIAKNKWIETASVDCWYTALRDSLNITDETRVVDPETFVSDVRKFLGAGPNARYSSRIIFNNSKITGCSFSATYIYRETNDDEVDALESVRKSADSVGFGNDADDNPAAFPYQFGDTFSEQYSALPAEIGISLGLASVAVALVCFFLIGHPLVALISVLVVGIIIINVLGLTFYSGVNINSVSVITLVLCTGIAVDFVVHISRSFLEQVGTRSERAVKALAIMGPPVFYAGFSTFLAIVILAGARSYIFQVIFLGFLFLVVMGFIHGLLFTPIILSLFGPGSFYLDEAEKEAAEKSLEERVTRSKALGVEAEAAAETTTDEEQPAV